MGFGELFCVRGVADLPVEGDDVRTGADRGQRLAECQPGGDLGAHLVTGQLDLAAWPGPDRSVRRPWPADCQVTFTAQLDDGSFGHLRWQGLAVPALAVFDFVEAAALAGASQDHGGPVRVGRAGQRLIDVGDVVPVNGDGVAAERFNPLGVRVDVPAEFGRAALAEAVHVDDRGQVGQPVIGRLVERLPHGPFGHLAVTAEHPDAVRQLVEIPAGQGDADPVGKSLAKRAGGDVDPRQHRRGVTLKQRAEPPVAGHQLFVGDDARRLEHRVKQRGRVALGKDQVVVGRVARPLPVVAEMTDKQHRHQVRGRHARRGMARSGGGAAPDRVDPQLLTERANIVQGLNGHGDLLHRRL